MFWEQRAGGSNPLSPTNNPRNGGVFNQTWITGASVHDRCIRRVSQELQRTAAQRRGNLTCAAQMCFDRKVVHTGLKFPVVEAVFKCRVAKCPRH